MMLPMIAVGALVASAAHLSVSRHAPPAGWGYAWAVYEAGLPCLLVIAIAWQGGRDELLLAATVLALLGAAVGAYVATHARPALLRDLTDAQYGRALRHGVRWRRSAAAQELDRIRADLRRSLGEDPDSDPPEA